MAGKARTNDNATTDGRRLRGKRTREDILEAAEATFAEKGFAGTSMRDLAKACGVSLALIYHHFETKEGLFSAVVKRFMDQETPTFFEELDQLEDLGEFLIRGMHAHFLSHLRHPHLARLTAWIMLEADHWNLEFLEEPFDWALTKVQDVKDAGYIRDDVEPKVMWLLQDAAVTYWMQMKQSFGELFGVDRDDPSVDEYFIRQAMDILVRGIGTGKLIARWEELRGEL